MSIYDVDLAGLSGEPLDLSEFQGQAVLIVNNQSGAQEPGSPEEIATFCSTSYGVSFPMTEKVEVNGDQRHPLYRQLVSQPHRTGEAGDIQWNFEKFLISPDGDGVARFRPTTDPEADEVVGAIQAALPA